MAELVKVLLVDDQVRNLEALQAVLQVDTAAVAKDAAGRGKRGQREQCKQ